MIIGVDAGNYEVKVVHQRGVDRFPSDIGEYRERNLKQKFSEDDMIALYKGRNYFAGTLAKYESEFNARIMGDSKAHADAKLRILIALHRAGHDVYKIIVGQPIEKHTEDEKDQIKNMLRGSHSIVINGDKREFFISQVEVAAEGGSAFWAMPQDGIVRLIDVGSGTINCATLYDMRYIDKDSFSIPIGMNTTKTKNYEALARTIAAETGKKWGYQDVVKVVGGAAEKILPYIRGYFPLAETVCPIVDGKTLEPVFCNAVGFYRIGVNIYA